MHARVTSLPDQPAARVSAGRVLECLVRFVGWSGLLVPAAWLVAFWSLVLRARLHLGEWPRGGQGVPPNFEPSTLDPSFFQLHTVLVWAFSAALLLVTLPSLGVLLASAVAESLRPARALACAFVVACVLVVFTMLDWGGFWTWFLD